MPWILALVLFAAEADAPILTLNGAIGEAIDRQPLLTVASENQLRARARNKHEHSIDYPQITATAQVIEGSNNASNTSFLGFPDYPRIAGTVGSGGIPNLDHPSYVPRTNSFVGLGAHYRVLDFGYSRGRLGAAQATSDAADALAQQTLQDVIFQVSAAYLQAVAAKQTLLIAQDTQHRAQEHYNLANAGVKSGMRPAIDMARIATELAAADLGVIRSQNALLIARSSLNTIIAWAPPPYTVVAPPEPTVQPLSSEEIFALALSRRPDLAAYVAQERAADSLVDSANALNFPQLDATASVSTSGVNQPPYAVNYDVGLVLSFPLFTGFAIEAQRDEAQAQLGASRARIRLLKTQVAHQLEEARDTLLSAAEAVKAATVQVTGALAALNQAEARYREGLGNIVELTDAQSQYDVAQQGLIQSVLARALSDVQLKYAYAGLEAPKR